MILKDSDVMIFRKAILIIHGFLGGTYDLELLANNLELNKNFDVFQFTLPGHERNFSKVTYQEWIKSCEDNVEWLISKGYKNIYVIGHSMGGVITAYLATKYKEIKKIVLAAPAFHYLSITNEKVDIPKSIKTTPSIVKTYSIQEIISRMFKLNLESVIEFKNLVKKYYECPKNITCPTLIIQGKNDEIVPVSSSLYVYNSIKSDNKKLVFVDKLTHDVFKEENIKLINIVDDFLKHTVKGGIYNI